MSRIQAQITAAVVVGVMSVGLVLEGADLKFGWIRFVSIAAFVLVLLNTIWERWVWRVPVLQRFERVPPDIRGTWRGKVRTEWIDPATKQTAPPKPAYLVVRQTFREVSVTLLTDENRSSTTLAQLTRVNGTSQLDYMYLSRPDSSVAHRSPMHHGSTSLVVSGAPGRRLKGRYWTDRNTRGELDFNDRNPNMADDFDGAASLFNSATP